MIFFALNYGRKMATRAPSITSAFMVIRDRKGLLPAVSVPTPVKRNKTNKTFFFQIVPATSAYIPLARTVSPAQLQFLDSLRKYIRLLYTLW